MAEQNQTPSTPGTSGVTKDDVAAQIAAAVKPLTDAQVELTKNLGVIADTLKALPPAAAAKKDEKADAPLTADAVKAIVGDALKANQTQAGQEAARQQFAAEKLKGVPAVYAAGLGTDPAKWESEAATIAGKYQADLKAAGFAPKDLGNAAAAGGTPTAAKSIDLSKVSGADLLSEAVVESGKKPVSAGEQTVTIVETKASDAK